MIAVVFLLESSHLIVLHPSPTAVVAAVFVDNQSGNCCQPGVTLEAIVEIAMRTEMIH